MSPFLRLIGLGPDLYPVEIKAGMTINRDYFKGLNHFSSLFPLPHGPAIVYAGDQLQERTDGTAIYPVADFHKMLSKLEP